MIQQSCSTLGQKQTNIYFISLCHRYTLYDEPYRKRDESQHHQHQGHCVPESSHRNAHNLNQTQQNPPSEEDEILYKQETSVTLSRASSSSLSSNYSSSSSFSSWYTDPNVNDAYTHCYVQQPLHSLSCSNIADVRGAFREDDGGEPIVFATVKHGKNSGALRDSCGGSHKETKHVFSSLDKGHSRSEEGLLKGNESDLGEKHSRIPHMTYGSLYKTSSLNRSLAFSEEDIVLGVSRSPKRAVSSSQLPSKGILKNKEPNSDIRKAKSMEVLSSRQGHDPKGQKGKGITQIEIEQARANFVQGKLQFSAFLDEITKQVISPSDLTMLGVNDSQTARKAPVTTQVTERVKPQLPPKKHRESLVENREGHVKGHDRHEKATHKSPRKHSNCSNPDKLKSYPAKNHHGSPPPHQFTQSSRHSSPRGRNRKERKSSATCGSNSGERYARYGPHLTDGTSTSPEPCQLKEYHSYKNCSAAPSSHYTPQFPVNQPQQVHPGISVGAGLGSECSSTKSDSSRTRDSASTATSHSLEHTGEHDPHYTVHCKQCGVSLCFFYLII